MTVFQTDQETSRDLKLGKEALSFRSFRPLGLRRFSPLPTKLHHVKPEFDGRNITSQLAIAAVAAGVVTSYAVSQGQSPLIALGITIFSAVAAVALGQWI